MRRTFYHYIMEELRGKPKQVRMYVILLSRLQVNPISTIIKLKKSLIYSLRGLVYISKQLSFQLELIYLLSSAIALKFLPFSIWENTILVSTLLLLLVMEILNSAIELIVDRLSPEKSDFARNSKDLGSAAVFLVLIVSFIQWGVLLCLYFGN